MQRAHDDDHTSHTPPPPYTPVADYRGPNVPPSPLPPPQQYHSQNPYPAPVVMTEDDYRLAQKLQDEEYALWADRQQQQQQQQQQHHHQQHQHQPQHQHQHQHQHQQQYQHQHQLQRHHLQQQHPSEFLSRPGGSSTGPHNSRPPLVSSVSDHYQCSNPYSHQNGNSQQRQPVIYASPNQPSLPYTQTAPYANGCGAGASPYYGSMNQGYYPAQSHPFYNAPYYPYQQGPQQHTSYREAEEEDLTSGCLNGLLAASVLWCFCSLCEE